MSKVLVWGYLFGHDSREFYTSLYLNLAQINGKLGYLFVF